MLSSVLDTEKQQEISERRKDMAFNPPPSVSHYTPITLTGIMSDREVMKGPYLRAVKLLQLLEVPEEQVLPSY